MTTYTPCAGTNIRTSRGNSRVRKRSRRVVESAFFSNLIRSASPGIAEIPPVLRTSACVLLPLFGFGQPQNWGMRQQGRIQGERTSDERQDASFPQGCDGENSAATPASVNRNRAEDPAPGGVWIRWCRSSGRGRRKNGGVPPMRSCRGGLAINEMNWDQWAVMAGVSALFIILAWWRFNRRDVRYGAKGRWGFFLLPGRKVTVVSKE
jgi:hypothetical protein